MVRLATEGPEPDTLHAPAHSIAAEQAVLGGLLLDNRAWDRICDLLTEADFSRTDHRTIYHHIGALIEANRPADPVTLQQHVEPDLVPYLGELFAGTPSAANIRAHAQIVRDRAILRELRAIGGDIAALADTPGIDSTEAAQQAEERILAVLSRDARDAEAIAYKFAVFEAVDWMEERRPGLSTGVPAIDRMAGGMQPGQLWVVAGRPSMGKSAFSMQIAEHVAVDVPVAVFSLEMSRRQIAARSLRYHEGQLSSREAATAHLCGLRMMIDDGGRLTPSLLRLRLRHAKRRLGRLSLVVVDYLQLMSVPGAESRLQEVSEISRALRAIAKEFGCAVLAVAQLSRAPENRADKRPLLSDLRESGQLEQDADVVVMLHREEYYSPDTHLQGFAELLVRKCRDGQTGTVWCRWEPSVTRFREYDGPLPQPAAVARDSNRVRPFRARGGAA